PPRPRVREAGNVAFSYTVDGDRDVARVSLVGEIDMNVSDRVPAVVQEAVTEYSPLRLEVDLGALDFCDSSGIASLFAARAVAEGAGCRFAVVNVRGMVRRVMEITGVLTALSDAGEVGPATLS